MVGIWLDLGWCGFFTNICGGGGGGCDIDVAMNTLLNIIILISLVLREVTQIRARSTAGGSIILIVIRVIIVAIAGILSNISLSCARVIGASISIRNAVRARSHLSAVFFAHPIVFRVICFEFVPTNRTNVALIICPDD